MTPNATFLPATPGPIPLRPQTETKLGSKGAVRPPAETAREFEATLLGLLLKEMRQASLSEEGMFPGDTGDVCGGLFDLYMGQHLAASGGFGVAAALERQLRTTYAAATGNRHPPDGGTLARPTGG